MSIKLLMILGKVIGLFNMRSTTDAPPPKPLKKKKKIVHMAWEYPCIHCGYVETECGEEVVDNSGTDDWTMDEKKVTCKECKSSLKETKRLIK